MSQEVVRIGQLEIHYLIDGANEGGLGVFEMKVPPGARVQPPHSHSNNEECVYVLEGVLRCSVDDETRELQPGDWMSTPRGSVHHFSNSGRETARSRDHDAGYRRGVLPRGGGRDERRWTAGSDEVDGDHDTPRSRAGGLQGYLTSMRGPSPRDAARNRSSTARRSTEVRCALFRP